MPAVQVAQHMVNVLGDPGWDFGMGRKAGEGGPEDHPNLFHQLRLADSANIFPSIPGELSRVPGEEQATDICTFSTGL